MGSKGRHRCRRRVGAPICAGIYGPLVLGCSMGAVDIRNSLSQSRTATRRDSHAKNTLPKIGAVFLRDSGKQGRDWRLKLGLSGV
jgi:hypothetical protein